MATPTETAFEFLNLFPRSFYPSLHCLVLDRLPALAAGYRLLFPVWKGFGRLIAEAH